MKKIIPLFIVLGICLIFMPQAWATLDDGLVGYWPFNGNADDGSGNGYPRRPLESKNAIKYRMASLMPAPTKE